jgi:hypothetical protein
MEGAVLTSLLQDPAVLFWCGYVVHASTASPHILTTCCSGQAYVAAFLAKPDKATVEDSAAVDKAKGAAGSSSSSEGGTSAADELYEVGTFAQVHTMMSGDSPDSAQLLLLGHRRLKREATVRMTGRCLPRRLQLSVCSEGLETSSGIC